MTLHRGFTLLEMLVVLVLLGLITTMALPAMQRWHDAVLNKAQAGEIIDSLRAAGFSAGANRRDIVVDHASFQASAAGTQPETDPAGGDPLREPRIRAVSPGGTPTASNAASDTAQRLPLTLPQGWRVESVNDIRFLANGLCRPGSLQLRTARGDIVNVEVRGPICGVELAQASEGRRP